ncbi:hypothetical protein [Tsukamurella soli]|uniref:Acyl-CoA carboxylase epsilon subunit n=1 Tax=Tsukamurella soli TaxID=644556 RepID=A0ABP8KI81_9ACTN
MTDTRKEFTDPRFSLEDRRLATNVAVFALEQMHENVPQQMRDFADGLVDDPGPLPKIPFPAPRRSRWQRLRARYGL